MKRIALIAAVICTGCSPSPSAGQRENLGYTATCAADSCVASEDWRTMESAPRDATVVEIRNGYGLMPTYGLFRWTDEEWSMDSNCVRLKPTKQIIAGESCMSPGDPSKPGYHPAALIHTGTPGWMAPGANQYGGSGLMNEPIPEQHYRWRPYHGTAYSTYVDPTRGRQYTPGYWRAP